MKIRSAPSLSIVHCLLSALWVAIVGVQPSHAADPNPPSPKYILFLTADGFRSDYIERFAPPHLGQLIAEGVRVTNAVNVFPTLTTPNMASLATGALPRTTGVGANTQYERETDKIVRAPRTTVETIGGTLRKAGWVTGAVNHFMFEHAVDHYVTAGYADAEKTTDAIIDLLEHKDARFVGAIYGITDQAGHRYGPDSVEVREGVLAIDKGIGRLVAWLKQRGIYEQTLITFNSDHGMSAFARQQVPIEPAKALANAGFRVAGSAEQLKDDTQIIVLDFGVRIIYFRNLPEADRARATTVIRQIDHVDLLGRKELDALGCHDSHSGDLIASPQPGFAMSNAGKSGGLHGGFGERNPILFFRGPGIRVHATVDSAQTIDVVPTVLRLVNVPPASIVDGKVIAEALAPAGSR